MSAGHAELDGEVLVDSLVEVIDGLRGELHPTFGVRPYRVFVVRRSYEGQTIGDGPFVDREVELLPQPKVWNFGKYELNPGGLNERGETKLTEVSLTYNHEDLAGAQLGESEQLLYRVGEAMGQGNPDRWFQLSRPPFVDRERDMGWVLYLRAIDVPGCSP